MPILSVLMSGLFASLADFFVQFFSKEIALRMAFGALFVAGFTTLLVAVQATLTSIAFVMPAGLVAAFQTAFPSNLATCVSAAITVDSLVVGYRLYIMGAGGR